MATLNLDKFHNFSKSGEVTGVNDYAVAQHIKEDHPLFVMGGKPYIYENGCYFEDQSGAKLKTLINQHIYPRFIRSTTAKRIYDLILSDSELQTGWESVNRFDKRVISFENCLYDPVKKEVYKHDPKYRGINMIPHKYNPNIKVQGGKIKEWLEGFCPDPEDREMLLQFFGLCFNRDTSFQKCLLLVGEGGTGKSLAIRLLQKMVGAKNCSNVSLKQLEGRFYPYLMMGKLLNSCADLEISTLEDTSVFKKSLGEDVLLAEAKGKDAITFQSYASQVFSTNELPLIKGERTNGFYRRLCILTVNNVPEERDPYLFEKLSTDIDGLISLSVKALERLYQSGQFAESQNSKNAVKRMRCDSDSVEDFLENQICKKSDGRIKKLDCYHSYELFCQNLDRQSLSKQNFYKAMRSKNISEIRSMGTDYYKGIDYIDEGFKDVDEELPFE